MDTILEHQFTTIVENPTGRTASNSEFETTIQIDPLNFTFSIEFDPQGRSTSGRIKAILNSEQFSRFLRTSRSPGFPTLNDISPGWNLPADKVLVTPFFREETEVDSLYLRTTPMAKTWYTDEIGSRQYHSHKVSGIFGCKLYRSGKVSKVEYEAEQILDSDTDIRPNEHANTHEEIEQAVTTANEADNEYFKHLSWMSEIAKWSHDFEPLLLKDRRELLSSTTHGERAIRHIREADYCYELGLKLPALASYIHSIEWSIIAYLDLENKADLIEDELDDVPQNGYYSYPDVVNELGEHTDVDQTMISRLQALNKQRQWMAHHKSGEIQDGDIENVRYVLKLLLEYLFD